MEEDKPASNRGVNQEKSLGYKLRKSPNCITRRALTWDRKGKRKRGRLKCILCRKMEANIKRMNSN